MSRHPVGFANEFQESENAECILTLFYPIDSSREGFSIAIGNDGSMEMIPDYSTLISNYQRVIASGLSLLTEENAEVLIVGLGGGILPMFLQRHFHFHLQVVELDPIVHDIARQCFDLDTSIPIHIADGIDDIHRRKAEGCSLDVLIVDVGSSDDTFEIACPPSGFLSLEFLESCKACLRDHGIMIMNIVTRSRAAWTSTVATLKEVFPYLYAIPTAEDVNRIVFAGKADLDFDRDAPDVTWHPHWESNDILKDVEQL